MPPVTAYASQTDLTDGINPGALSGVTSAQMDKAIDDASREIDSYLRAQYTLPLLTVGPDVRRKTVDIAIYYLMVGRGYNPEAGGDPGIKQRYDNAILWLRLVSKGEANPDITDSTQAAAEGRHGSRPTVISSSQRGFSARDNTTGGRWPFQGD
jgi:phage gp36-like protein